MMSRPPIFLLGCQRSGTTWLANIFDTNPATLLFMEPFSVPYALFPEFPGTNTFVEKVDEDLAAWLRECLPKRLLRYKHFVCERSITHPSWFQVDRWLARLVGRATRFGPASMQNAAKWFELLNLNRAEKLSPICQKDSEAPFWCIKELRLAGKIPLLLEAFPNAQYAVLIRHPAATVHAIETWFSRGRLIELQRDLTTYLDDLQSQPIAGPYRAQIERCRNGSMAHRLALYWRVSYETIARRLEGNADCHFVTYEELATEPRRVVAALWAKLGLQTTDSLDAYLQSSTKRDSNVIDPLSTQRHSASHYDRWQNAIEPGTLDDVAEIVSGSPLLERFAPFYG